MYGVGEVHLYSITCYWVNIIYSPTGAVVSQTSGSICLRLSSPPSSYGLGFLFRSQSRYHLLPAASPGPPSALLGLLANKPPLPVSQSAGSWKRGGLGCADLTQGDLLPMQGLEKQSGAPVAAGGWRRPSGMICGFDHWFIYLFPARLCRTSCAQGSRWVLRKSWRSGETHPQEVTMQGSPQGPQKSGLFKPEWALGTLLSLKLSFGEATIVPTCGPKGKYWIDRCSREFG